MSLARFAGSMLAATALWLTAAPTALAQSETDVITLKSFDGFTQLRGKLVGFDGQTFTIETVLGVIQVDALQVDCEGEACPANLLFGAAFGIHGSNTIGAELMPALIEGYADSLDATLVSEIAASDAATLRIVSADGREMAAIDLLARGSSIAFNSLGEGEADIGMSSRRVVDRDLSAFDRAGLEDPRDTDAEHVVALDGLIAIVHPSNPIKSVSLEELALIFSGALTNWSQLGGRDAPINLYAGDDQSGTFQTFNQLVLGPFNVGVAATAQRFPSNIQLSDRVAGDPFAMGVTAVAFERAAKSLAVRQACGIVTYPTTFAMKTEEYPLARRLYLYAPRRDMTAHARQLVQFTKSSDAQPLIEEAGFVNLMAEEAGWNQQGDRIIYALTGEEEVSVSLLREFLTEVRDGSRMSTTFRFTAGSSQLEPRSARDAEQLARDIAAGIYEGKEVMLVGFTDSVGQFELNRALSQRRAQVVEAFIRASVPEADLEGALITATGYGELAPVGCNTTLQGRSVNRRVEVWIRDAQN
ncbi:MAG: phosphate ABC transporter substrate-binding/OmpA family protein [Pseudomonadota bacterium]